MERGPRSYASRGFAARYAAAMDRPEQGERVAERLEGAIWGHLVGDRGLPPDEAIARVRAVRPGTVERRSQEEFVRAWGERQAQPDHAASV